MSEVCLSCTGLHYINNVIKLQHLVLWNCLRLTEGGLSSLSGLTQMTHLSLRGCQQLTDHALPHLAVLTALRQLNLTACERMSGVQGLSLQTALFHKLVLLYTCDVSQKLFAFGRSRPAPPCCPVKQLDLAACKHMV